MQQGKTKKALAVNESLPQGVKEECNNIIQYGGGKCQMPNLNLTNEECDLLIFLCAKHAFARHEAAIACAAIIAKVAMSKEEAQMQEGL